MEIILKNLSHDELFHLIVSYNSYVQEFDYIDSETPVSIYEFFEYEYQEILEENSNMNPEE